MLFLSPLINELSAQGMSYKMFVGGNMSYYRVKYDFGVRGIDTSYLSDSKLSLNFGVSAKYDFVRNFGINFEAQYVRKSGKITSNRVGGIPGLTALSRDYISYTDYIQLGLLPQVNIPVITKSNIYLTAGPYYSFSMTSSETINELSALQGRTYGKDIGNNISSSDMGIILGLGVEFLESPGVGFTTGFRYSAGLQNILNIPDKDKISIRNNSFNFNVGIILK
jgi:hypothetical protein